MQNLNLEACNFSLLCKTFSIIVWCTPSCKCQWATDFIVLHWHDCLRYSTSSSDALSCWGDLHCSTLPPFLKWLNQHWITLLTVTESVLHCYNGFTFSQSNDKLHFPLHACNHINCSNGSICYSYNCIVHVKELCIKTSGNACLKKLYELVNTLQWISFLHHSSHKLLHHKKCT
jgi:hypothetical protein